MGLEWIDIFMNNFLGFLTGITGLLAFFVERRKRIAEQKQSEADALQGMQGAYEKFVLDFNQKLTEMSQQIVDLKNQLQSARTRIAEFEEQAERDKKEIIMLRRKIEAYERELRSYKKTLK